VAAPSLAVFKAGLDGAPSNLVWWNGGRCPCSWQGAWNEMIFESSLPTQTLLRFYDIFANYAIQKKYKLKILSKFSHSREFLRTFIIMHEKNNSQTMVQPPQQ